MSSLIKGSDTLLGIKPDCSQTAETVYTEIAMRVFEANQNLYLFESCDLATTHVEIPSWVPDWSVSWRGWNANTAWSACGWICAHISVLDAQQLCVSGILVTRVGAIVCTGIEDVKGDKNKCDAIMEILRAVEQRARELADRLIPQRQWVEMFCSIATNARQVECYSPFKSKKNHCHSLQLFINLVEAVCFYPDQIVDPSLFFLGVLLEFWTAWRNMEFLITEDGRVALAVSGTKEGGSVSVLLGSKFAVVLRP